MANRKSKVDREQVIKLAALNCSATEIGHWFGVTKVAIHKYYQKELNIGRSKGNISLKRKLYDMAMGGNIKALEIALKNQCGYSDKVLFRDNDHANSENQDAYEFVTLKKDAEDSI